MIIQSKRCWVCLSQPGLKMLVIYFRSIYITFQLTSFSFLSVSLGWATVVGGCSLADPFTWQILITLTSTFQNNEKWHNKENRCMSQDATCFERVALVYVHGKRFLLYLLTSGETLRLIAWLWVCGSWERRWWNWQSCGERRWSLPTMAALFFRLSCKVMFGLNYNPLHTWFWFLFDCCRADGWWHWHILTGTSGELKSVDIISKSNKLVLVYR